MTVIEEISDTLTKIGTANNIVEGVISIDFNPARYFPANNDERGVIIKALNHRGNISKSGLEKIENGKIGWSNVKIFVRSEQSSNKHN